MRRDGKGDNISPTSYNVHRPKNEPLLSASNPPRYRPRERFWPYVELPEQLTDEEIAALDPDLHAELFGAPPRPFSVTLVFPVLDSPDYARAVEMAKASAEYRETGSGLVVPPSRAVLAGRCDQAARSVRARRTFRAREVLMDDRPVPYARELWLPLIWFLIPR